MRVPVVVIALERGGWSLPAALNFLQHLRDELPHRNPGALEIIEEVCHEAATEPQSQPNSGLVPLGAALMVHSVRSLLPVRRRSAKRAAPRSPR